MAKKLSRRKRAQLVKSARKSARKKKPSKPEELKKRKIQTANPFLRLTFIIIGLALMTGGIYLLSTGKPFGWLFFGISLAFLLMGFFGSRKTLDQALDGADSAITNQIFDRIFDGLF